MSKSGCDRADPAIGAQQAAGSIPVVTVAVDFDPVAMLLRADIAAEIEKWGRVIRAAGVQVE